MNTFGTRFRVTTFGESHGLAIGCVIDGCPPGLHISEAIIQPDLDRRKPGSSAIVSQRKEDDRVEILSGVFEGRTTGTPLALLIRNKDHDPDAYAELKDVFRPGHADRAYLERYGLRDHRGGGRSSGRETAARVAAGAVAKEILKKEGITIIGHTVMVAGIEAVSFDEEEIRKNPISCADALAAVKMIDEIEKAKSEKDSVGGIVEIRVRGVKPGLGEPIFGKLDAAFGHALLSIGAVKGVEFGAGFSAASHRGSENNDEMDKDKYLTNNAGGILGGITTGQEIVVRCAVKPTPSIGRPQKTIGTDGCERTIEISGRHDPCIVPRLVPVAEAMVALVLADALIP